MKRILLLISFTAITGAAMAQWAVNANYNLWIPTDKYNSDLKLGVIGANVEAKYYFDDHLAGTISAGYALLSYDKVLVDRVEKPAADVSSNAKLQIIPVTIGANVYFTKDKVKPYFDMDFGAAMVQVSGDGLPKTDMKVNAFISPGFGIEYEFANDLMFNASLKKHVLIYDYDNRTEFYETFTAIGLNLGVTYRF
jgi:hypothetical protein